MNDKKIKYLRYIRNHVMAVQKHLNSLASELIERGRTHDASKFSEPELSGFAENIDNVSNIVYGSTEHSEKMDDMKVIIDIHHSNNRHHPEHWGDGVSDMTLLDILEMIVDWKTASSQYKEGDLIKSVEINCKKYKVDDQLKRIILNTISDHLNNPK